MLRIIRKRRRHEDEEPVVKEEVVIKSEPAIPGLDFVNDDENMVDDKEMIGINHV
jgi:hypothetical protein